MYRIENFAVCHKVMLCHPIKQQITGNGSIVLQNASCNIAANKDSEFCMVPPSSHLRILHSTGWFQCIGMKVVHKNKKRNKLKIKCLSLSSSLSLPWPYIDITPVAWKNMIKYVIWWSNCTQCEQCSVRLRHYLIWMCILVLNTAIWSFRNWPYMILILYLVGKVCIVNIYGSRMIWLEQKYYAPQARPNSEFELMTSRYIIIILIHILTVILYVAKMLEPESIFDCNNLCTVCNNYHFAPAFPANTGCLIWTLYCCCSVAWLWTECYRMWQTLRNRKVGKY